MKRLLFLVTPALMGMQVTTPKMSKKVSWDKDMNSYPLPGQVQMEDDIAYLDSAYQQMKDKINEQTRVIKDLMASVSYAHKRIDFIQDSLENINRRVNRLPWYKRLNCFKRR